LVHCGVISFLNLCQAVIVEKVYAFKHADPSNKMIIFLTDWIAKCLASLACSLLYLY